MLRKLMARSLPGISGRLSKTSEKDPARKMISLAEEASKAKAWNLAEARWEQVLRHKGDQAPAKAYLRLCQALRRQNRLDDAQKALSRGLGLHPDSLSLEKEQAELATAKGEWALAAKSWQRYLDGCTGQMKPGVFIKYAKTLHSQHLVQEAEAVLEEAEARHGKDNERLMRAKALMLKDRALWEYYQRLRDSQPLCLQEQTWQRVRASMDEYCSTFPDSRHKQRLEDYRMLSRLNLMESAVARGDWAGFQGQLRDYLCCLQEKQPGFLRPVQEQILATRRQRVQQAVNAGQSSLERQRQGLQAYLSQAEAQALNPKSWLWLHTLLWREGCITASGLCRQKAAKQALQEAQPEGQDPEHIYQGLLAALDQRELELADRCRQRLPGTGLKMRQLGELSACLDLLSGQAARAEAYFGNQFNAADQEFLDCIKGKSVAVVGNADSLADQKQEIESFDIVLALNVPHRDLGLDRGGNTKILSLSSTFEKFYDLRANLANLQDVDWIIAPRNAINFEPLLRQGLKVRLKSPKLPLFSGIMNHGMIAFYDLLKFGPKYVKLFHMNFYLSQQIYSSQYMQRISNKKSSEFSAYLYTLLFLVYHDSISQLNFTNSFYQQGLIDADQECAAVLNMSQGEYLQRMQAYLDRLREIAPNPWSRS
ncbi:MAG: tetratricopeptide repeat protein [Desulfohalobiaceae bacterium]